MTKGKKTINYIFQENYSSIKKNSTIELCNSQLILYNY